MKRLITLFLTGIVLFFTSTISQAQTVKTDYREMGDTRVFTLWNDEVAQKVFVTDDVLQGDALLGQDNWLAKYHNANHGVQTDGNYELKLMWTAWSAPGKQTNADVQISLTKKDYQYTGYQFANATGGGKELHLFFVPFNRENTIRLEIIYQLLPGKFYAKRKIELTDSIKQDNWIQEFVSRQGIVSGDANWQAYSAGYLPRASQSEDNRIIKKGAFGQPCAVDFARGGAFFGIEYPAATSMVKRKGADEFTLNCSELTGRVIKKQGVESQWVVEGLAPDHYVKDWFYSYLPDIRVAPNRPYALYNSWYDLRSPEYTKVAANHIMNQKNVMNLITQLKKNMIDKYGIHLDAFVLDDGWDNTSSDWQMNKTTFPHGFKPIADELRKSGTTLGVWFGPTGGYGFRMHRIDWMKAHGYEVTGFGSNDPMLCIGGKNYSDLFRRRTTEMVANEGVGYFKWDGIQFSCSEPDHGHPVGDLSRRAILDSVIAKCDAVRKINPKTFLNITSGTWLSPWWMQYANQIWMQGGDYGYADIPVVNERDGAVTYKDMVLYNDFHNLDEWFPVSNLMTHGIIKGELERLGGDDDPLDKFTDDAMLYFARGVSMYELYVSPDLLSEGEWNALSKSLQWAKDRFEVLDKSYMVGGDPAKGNAYGYVHFKNENGIIAVRNPGMKPGEITLKLDPALGLDPGANSLVLEEVYPYHRVSPALYAAGAELTLPLSGYETAVYEIYPVDKAGKPLVSGIDYEVKGAAGNHYRLNVLRANGDQMKLLNPEKVEEMKMDGKEVSGAITGDQVNAKIKDWLTDDRADFEKSGLTADFNIAAETRETRFIVFVKPDSAFQGQDFPVMKLLIDGKEVKATRQVQQGRWAVYSSVLPDAGKHTARFDISANDKIKSWKGSAEVWLTGQQEQSGSGLDIKFKEEIKAASMPPGPFYPGYEKESRLMGKGAIGL